MDVVVDDEDTFRPSLLDQLVPGTVVSTSSSTSFSSSSSSAPQLSAFRALVKQTAKQGEELV